MLRSNDTTWRLLRTLWRRCSAEEESGIDRVLERDTNLPIEPMITWLVDIGVLLELCTNDPHIQLRRFRDNVADPSLLPLFEFVSGRSPWAVPFRRFVCHGSEITQAHGQEKQDQLTFLDCGPRDVQYFLASCSASSRSLNRQNQNFD